MTRGRALLRNFVATPEPAEARPAKLPAMRGNQTMSAPARPDLWLLENDVSPQTPAADVEDVVSGPQALSAVLLGAAPVPQPLRRRQAHTLVPSALDAHSFTTLTEDDEWFGDLAPPTSKTLVDEWPLDLSLIHI